MNAIIILFNKELQQNYIHGKESNIAEIYTYCLKSNASSNKNAFQ